MRNLDINNNAFVRTVVILCIGSWALWGQGSYTIQDLGPLPGKPESWATAINDGGVVVGLATDAGRAQPYQAFRWAMGTMTYLGNLGGGQSVAYDINNNGQIVGESPAGPLWSAFIVDPGSTMRLLPPLVTAGVGAAYAVSSDGRATGFSEVQATVVRNNPRTGEQYLAGRHAALWNPPGTSAIDLGVLPGGDQSIGFGVNRSGTVLGQAMTPNGARAFVWTASGGMQALPEVPDILESGGRKINDAGVGTVIVWRASGGTQIYRWSANGGMEGLGNCPGYGFGFAIDINEAGTIVGTCRNTPGGEHAAVSVGGQMLDLNVVADAANKGWFLTEAWGIDNQGRIVGIGRHGSETRAFLAAPPTTPVTVQLTSSTGVGLAGGVAAYQDTNGIWQTIGTTGPDGKVQGQAQAGVIRVRMTYGGRSQEKTQDSATPFTFSTGSVQLQFSDGIDYLDETGVYRTYTKPAMEMLPGDATFRFGVAGTLTFTLSGGTLKKTVAAERVLSSAGVGLSGATGSYYVGSWQACTSTGAANPGYVFCVLDNFVSNATFRLDYAFTSNQKSQNIAADSYVGFQTTLVRMQLKDSLGNALDPGTARYYAGGWRDAGTTAGGETARELLPGSYPFTMSYAAGSQQKSQDVGANPVVVFQTVSVTARLIDSAGNGLDTGVAQYYAGGWLAFGSTAGGLVRKELLPGSYPFRMSYASGSLQVSQDVGVNPVVTFQTKAVVVRLVDSAGNPLDTGVAQYYAGGWLAFGSTASGQVSKELLPGSYPFTMSYASGSQQKSQDIGANPVVVFQTKAVVVRLIDSAGNPLDTGVAQYYAGSWLAFGSTVGGQVGKELLPASYAFRMSYAGGSLQVSQDVGVNPVVTFQTKAVTVRLVDSGGNPLDTGVAQYYAGGWLGFGSTAGGQVSKELLPASYPFTMSYAWGSQQKSQDVGVNPVVTFQTGKVHSASGTCTTYYAGGWRAFVNDMELLPGSYPFQFSDGTGNVTSAVVGGVVNTIH